MLKSRLSFGEKKLIEIEVIMKFCGSLFHFSLINSTQALKMRRKLVSTPKSNQSILFKFLDLDFY